MDAMTAQEKRDYFQHGKRKQMGQFFQKNKLTDLH